MEKESCENCHFWTNLGGNDIPGFRLWGECRLEHDRMFVKLPEDPHVDTKKGQLLTANDFGCVQIRKMDH